MYYVLEISMSYLENKNKIMLYVYVFMTEDMKWYFVTKIGLTYCEKNAFLTCSWRFLRYNKLEQFEFKLEKIIGI